MLARAKQRRVNHYYASRNLDFTANTVQGIRLGDRDPERGTTIAVDSVGGVSHVHYLSSASYKQGAAASAYFDDGATKWADSLPRS